MIQSSIEIDLQEFIKRGRAVRQDWFAVDAPVNQIVETMVAMANSQGGLLVMGIVGKEIVGTQDPDSAIDHMLQAALATTPPLIISLPQIQRINQHQVIVAQIPSGMPHVYSHDGRYLQRDGSKNIALAPQELRRLMMERGEISFETEIAPSATVKDIDWEKASNYAKTLHGVGNGDVQDILLQRGCLAQQGEQLRPTNAGILLFGKQPQRYLRSTDISAVRFAGDNMSDTFSRQDIIGTLPDQIRRAETFLVDHLRKDVHLQDKMARQEAFEYPMEAARELVVNAVAHRDYSIQGDNIRLFLFSDHMEVHSPGGLPGPMTVENIRDERFSRNPIIVQILSDMGYIERLGYGVDRVMELMKQQMLTAPNFIERAGGFQVVLYNTIITETTSVVEETTPVTKSMFNGVYQGIRINPRQEAALEYLHEEQHSRITNSDLKNLFPDIHPETIRRDLAKLVNKDILDKMGQKRGSYYVLKGSESPDAKVESG